MGKHYSVLAIKEQIVLIDKSKSIYNPKIKLEEEKYYKDDGKKSCHSSCYLDKEL